ncbi:MAG: Hca operon transcriptional activator HcaR [Deltaproteobacteria bacterium]|jgi:hypothetical protein|nr:Hca operon transcriptional activator HcaR [Deltaproteobacteria bacterium]
MGSLSFSLTQLQYFVKAAKTLNMTQAARDCHVSQPSISGAVHQLEDVFGTIIQKTLDRSGLARYAYKSIL